NSVASDNYQGGRLAADTLLRAGHRKIAFVAGLEDTSTSQEREQGLIDTLKENGVELYARAIGNYEFEVTRRAVVEMFEHRPGVDALFAANDYMAIATIDALRGELGKRVPEDVSVIGFDNIPAAAWGGYRLTTVEQPLDPMIEKAVEILVGRIERTSTEPQQVKFPVRLIGRSTVNDSIEN